MILVGTGAMAKEYAKVFHFLGIPFSVVGHTENGMNEFISWATSQEIKVDSFFRNEIPSDTHAVIATSVNSLYEMAMKTIQAGIKNILLEKPGSLYCSHLFELYNFSVMANADIRIAYNRRFYKSAEKAKEIIARDGLQSMFFVFGEEMKDVESSSHPANVKVRWIIASLSHVIDMTFYIGGGLLELTEHSSDDELTVLKGKGRLKSGDFSYLTNFFLDKRWKINFSTSSGDNYSLAPIEKLWELKKGNDPVLLAEEAPSDLKSGLLAQVQSFLGDKQNLPTVKEQFDFVEVLQRMGGLRK